MRLRAERRDRAFRHGAQLFLHERAFDDLLERLGLVRRSFARALLIGCPDPAWKDRLRRLTGDIEVADPGPLFAKAAGGRCVIEDRMQLEVASYDLCVAVGTLDTVNDLPQALLRIRFGLKPGGFLIGAMAGGDSLPRLRSAMRAADSVTGAASPHVHPRIEPSALAGLLVSAGFVDPVVDVDRIRVAYPSLADLVRDLRGMGATNMLDSRSRNALSGTAVEAAEAAFAPPDGRAKSIEQFEILHFAAWAPSAEAGGQG